VLGREFETATWLAAGVPAARHTDERALLHLLRASPSSQTGVMRTRRPRPATVPRSTFAGFCFPPELIVVAVRWYLRFALSYRDVEELLTERGVQVDHVTIYRWVQRFTPLLADAARPCRHLVGDRLFVDETYVKVAGRWRYVYRAIDRFGQSLTCSSPRGGIRWQPTGSSSGPSALRRWRLWRSSPTEQRPIRWCSRSCYQRRGTEPSGAPNNRVEADHGRLKARLRPMRGLKQDRSLRVIIAGHAFIQNVRRGHYELAVEEPANRRVAMAVDELILAI
jgi:IS6 family transposase